MTKLIYLAVSSLSLVAGPTVFAQSPNVVRIAVAGPLSGAQASAGKDNRNGVSMAIDELNAKGVVIGGKKAVLELVSEDDAADPKQGTAVANKLCDQKVNGVIGHYNSGTTIPASAIYHGCGLPHITVSATNPSLTKPGYETTLRMVATDDALGARMASYAKSAALTRIATVDDRSAGGQGQAEAFKRSARALGIEIVSEQYTSDKTTDFSAILTSIKSAKPQAIFMAVADAQAGPMLRQMDQIGMDGVVVLGGDYICTEKLPELAAGAKALKGVTCSEGGALLDKVPAYKAWKARYDAKYPGEFQLYSPHTYVATMFMVNAMINANSADPKVYLSELHKMQYDGMTGKIAFEPNGELKSPATTLFEYSTGAKKPK